MSLCKIKQSIEFGDPFRKNACTHASNLTKISRPIISRIICKKSVNRCTCYYKRFVIGGLYLKNIALAILLEWLRNIAERKHTIINILEHFPVRNPLWKSFKFSLDFMQFGYFHISLDTGLDTDLFLRILKKTLMSDKTFSGQ